ncbi:Hypothetical protein FKW44_024881 [Caligus rogercresseyi]|uniref:Uncharacterized protein n=1 Tax=Caligus rogercresseyi TaxID=217165 RepID=A0A7T8GMB0_CALRO|nr:Hypothetical protein FKW44_024881 [Caligus rogercresseyi]
MKILKATVSGATVYRTIKAFKELGKVSRKVQVRKKIVRTLPGRRGSGGNSDKSNLIHETDA